MTSPHPSPANRFPLADADLCVKCGLCLPHCPTYLDSRNEADSPRGRIAMMQALATSAIPQTRSLEAHLDGCLSCRACEPVCPAQVPYGKLIDAGRALMVAKRPSRSRALAGISFLLTRSSLRTAIHWLLWIYQRCGLQALLRCRAWFSRSRCPPNRLVRLESLLPALTRPRLVTLGQPASSKSAVIADADGDNRVQLFTGCISSIAETGMIEDAARLFAVCGYRVEAPAQQTCCGALDQHGGRTVAAQACATRNLQAFAGNAAVTALASGCAASLVDYSWISDQADAQAFAARVRDPARLLLARAERLRSHLRPLPMRVAVHTACTQSNVLRDARAIWDLLSLIPQIELLELDPQQRCCGAAGLHFVTQPAAADRLLQPKLDAANVLRPDFIVSGNIGCTLHLDAGLRRSSHSTAGFTVPVLHPLALLARQLD